MNKDKFEAFLKELVKDKGKEDKGSEVAGKSAHYIIKELIDWYIENHKK